jgi:hypothetical protein
MIHGKNFAEANAVTTHLPAATNSWIYVGDIPEELKTNIRRSIFDPDQLSIEVMRNVITLFGFDVGYAQTFTVSGKQMVDDKKFLGTRFYDSQNDFYLIYIMIYGELTIQLRYTGSLQPNAATCRLYIV